MTTKLMTRTQSVRMATRQLHGDEVGMSDTILTTRLICHTNGSYASDNTVCRVTPLWGGRTLCCQTAYGC